ncbi:hypothetical protein [Actinoplanes flavus]|uniref:Htaa protein n=1 Tax=Actinoplanes flavus TaxID=2820290 RepID=A0ABS3UQY4_9ACTN|nr:hypothetical protein [Actinoplanes flavus]MBO3741190.1 hypothetical protein [Actinoplanes flavus]
MAEWGVGNHDDATATGGAFLDAIATGGAFFDVTATGGAFLDVTATGGAFLDVTATDGAFLDATATGRAFLDATATGRTVLDPEGVRVSGQVRPAGAAEPRVAVRSRGGAGRRIVPGAAKRVPEYMALMQVKIGRHGARRWG